MIFISYVISLVSAIFWFFYLPGNLFSKIIALLTTALSITIFSRKIKERFWILSISPIIWSVGMTNIKISLLILILVIQDRFLSKWKFQFKILIGILTLVVFGFLLNKNNFPAVKLLDFRSSAIEVNQRFEEEYFLENIVYFPKLINKIAYNRYFFTYKNFIRNSIKLFDFDFIFFQEDNPKFEKSIVMFSWIWIWLFLLGIINYKKMINKASFWWWLIMSIIYFWFIDTYWFQKQIIIIFPISMLIVVGWNNLKKQKFLYLTVVLISFYAWFLNYFDLHKNKIYLNDNLNIRYEQNK